MDRRLFNQSDILDYFSSGEHENDSDAYVDLEDDIDFANQHSDFSDK
jgi:hypothetical protein